MSKHTPGAWHVALTWFDHAIVRWHIASEKDGSVWPICEHVIEDGRPSGQEQLQNAHLISAAPDLLALVRDAMTMLNGTLEAEAWYRRAQDAIAKAEGL